MRYDVELTPRFEAATPLNQAAEAAFNVVEGIPRDKNNFAPRFALAWDPRGNGKTVIRAGYGLFYDHPLLAVAFNATTADGALSTQLLSGGGTATRLPATVNPIAAMNASSIFQGVLNQGQLPLGYLPDEQRFDSKLPESLFVNQRFLSAGVPAAAAAVHASRGRRFQVRLCTAGEPHVGAEDRVRLQDQHRLYLHARPEAEPPAQRQHHEPGASLRKLPERPGRGPVGLEPDHGLGAHGQYRADRRHAAASLVSGVPGSGGRRPGPVDWLPRELCRPWTASPLATAAFFNFFRPSGPNPSFAALVPGGYRHAGRAGTGRRLSGRIRRSARGLE